MAEETVFERFGGAAGVAAVVDTFYARVEADPTIRPVYPEDLTPGREKLKLFLVQWFGGPTVYSDQFGHPRLRRRHYPFVISAYHSGRWLHHMRGAMKAHAVPDDLIAIVFARLAPIARQVVNENEDVPREPLGDAFLD